MKQPEIINTVEIDGREVRIDSLPEEERKNISLQIHDAIMQAAGYRRKDV